MYSNLGQGCFGPCKWVHSNIKNNEQATWLYSAIEPGIWALLLPPGWCPKNGPGSWPPWVVNSTSHHTPSSLH
jgi:hypothetical protein